MGEDQDRGGAELVFLFSHSVLLTGCLTEMGHLLRQRRVRLKAVCSLAKAWKLLCQLHVHVLSQRKPPLTGLAYYPIKYFSSF